MMYPWIIVVGVIALVIFLYAGKDGGKILNKETPLEILNRRYAKGEITKKEYEEQKQIINSKN